jgi:HlyD family secretion protein
MSESLPSPEPSRARGLTSHPRSRLGLGLLAAAALAVFVLFLIARFWSPSALEMVGTVERRSLELAAPSAERIVAIPVRPGQRVKQGDVLVRLDDEVAKLELEAGTASLAAAEANLEAARQEYQRIESLVRSRVGSKQQLDLAKRAFDEARAQRAERAARASQMKRRLEDHTLRAGADGVVDQIAFEVGERVPAGGVVAVVLADDAPWVRLWLPAPAAARVRPGQAVSVEVTGFEGRFEGRLVDVGREPEFTPHFALTERERDHLVYESRVVLEGSFEDMRPGIPATVRIALGPEPEAGGR